VGTASPPVPALIGRALVAIAAAAALAPTGAGARGLTLGFADDAFTSGDASLRETSLARTTEVGGTIVRMNVGWPAATAPGHPADPTDLAYDWSRADAAVDAARAHGLDVLLDFTGMPPWAQTKGAPRSVNPATWRPDATAIGQYGHALAAHFAGRVSRFQLWDEPNLAKHLTPQWSQGKPAAPAIYRAMLDSFYAGVKRAQPLALVVTAGTAPHGDRGHGARMSPVTFWRDVLARRVRFDVLAHHPAGDPTRHALNAGDVAVPDMGRLRRLLEHVHKRARLWVTDVSYDSRPPDARGIPVQTHARWLEHAFELLWRAGVDTITWSRVSNRSGVYFGDGRPKPAATAFRFPFVAGGNQVWTRAPQTGTLQIQRDGRTVRSLGVRAGQVLLLRLGTPKGSRLRGVIGGVRSLAWSVDR
jgi:hypothetical protein